MIDRRNNPSHGYRAVHLVVRYEKKLVEIQVRTHLQHLWAELSEKLSDQVGLALKYGGGDATLQTALLNYSSMITSQEDFEESMSEYLDNPEWEILKVNVDLSRTQISNTLKDVISKLPRRND
jgi:ppGpp synthetase/RelA/SpoT-type nucleotidyltranferase